MITDVLSPSIEDGSPDAIRSHLPERAAGELNTLRAQFEARLDRLESALANPDSDEPLEALVLDLARVATAEAAAAAERAVLDVQLASQAALEAERAVSLALRRDVEQGGQESADVDRRRAEAERCADAAVRDRDRLVGELEALRKASAEEAAAAAARVKALEEERDASAAKLGAVQRATAALDAVSDGPVSSPSPIAPNPVQAPEPAPLEIAPTHTQPTRRASRQAFHTELSIQIDGTDSQLVDLSVNGAQVLSPTALKPNHTVEVALPLEESVVSCQARIEWARLEPPSPGGSFRYRAGLFFTTANQAAVQAFMAHHANRQSSSECTSSSAVELSSHSSSE